MVQQYWSLEECGWVDCEDDGLIERRAFFVNGQWVPVEDREQIGIVNPETEQQIGSVPAGTAEDVDLAVAAARAALPGWSQTSVADRAAILNAVADALEGCKDSVAQLISSEMGTPYGFSQVVQVGNPVVVLRSYAELLETYSFEEQIKNSLVVREPIGTGGRLHGGPQAVGGRAAQRLRAGRPARRGRAAARGVQPGHRLRPGGR